MNKQSLTLKLSGIENWDALTVAVNGEVGTVTGSFITNRSIYYTALFPVYGAELTWIPAECCDVTEIFEPATS